MVPRAQATVSAEAIERTYRGITTLRRREPQDALKSFIEQSGCIGASVPTRSSI